MNDFSGPQRPVKVIVAQKGAREHFLAARALHRQGSLACLVVDWYAPKGGLLQGVFGVAARLIGARGRAALAAKAKEIPDHLVKVNWFNGLMGKWRQRSGHFRTSLQERNLIADIAFTKTVARSRLPEHDVFFGYSYMSLEMLEIEKSKGMLTILDQIDPGPVEFRLVADEMNKHPELAGPAPAYPAAYYERLRQEWDLADVIVVNSEWSRDALISEGVNAAKIAVLPLAYEGEKAEGLRLKAKGEVDGKTDEGSKDTEIASRRPLHVLWLGQVNVRKGIYYLIEAAHMLQDANVHFDIVGSIGISDQAVASAPSNMTFHGSVSRDRSADHYSKADVFVLPTLSDGFAITQLEAMAYGLPVITTPNCGKVVQDGKNGFVVPAWDAQALAVAISRFDQDRLLASRMSNECRATAKRFSIDSYGARLMEIIKRHC
jgi:glycosyltransferase involved in cell wall biosynthesis